ncbi:MAG: LLM class F420-dependent oxidoreductase [Candidatus Lambdaproteobacteria bacterium]|nr:LLM class F420-dependent oxidoreductase [Candidatus Lambdaproteobacteria bacterium]
MSLIVRGDAAKPATFDAMARKAEETGLDTLWCSDHLIIPKLTVSKYPGRADGQFPEPWKTTYWQPFSVLGYLAGRTSTVRLGTSVLILPMRNPIEVAAQVAELDVLSGGRMNFGVGVGWFVEETETLGYPFKLRGARANEGLAICKALWTEQPATYKGKFYQLDTASFGPKPMQKPHPPIYIGGHTAGALRRVARFGDVWHPFKVTPALLKEARPELTRHMEAMGRDVARLPIAPKVPLTFQAGPPREGQFPTEGRTIDILDGIRAYRDEGATEMTFDILVETLDNALATMDRLSADVRPRL